MYNKAILVGRLTADPELKTTQSGHYVTSFNIACDRRYSRDGERTADFITVVAWRQTAEFTCRYFRKGGAIGVEGSIQTRSYEDRQGNKRTAVEVVADNVFFVGGKGSGENTAQPPVATAPSDFEEVEVSGDLPF